METIWVLVSIATVISLRVPVLNLIGNILGRGNCPSCGNSWYWNGAGSIDYKALEKVKGIMISDGIPSVVSIQRSKGLMICERCLGNPDSIDPGKIKHRLIKYGWESGDVELIVQAIKIFKQAKKS